MLKQFLQPPKPGQAHGKPFKTNKKLSKDKVKVKGTVCGDKKKKNKVTLAKTGHGLVMMETE